MLVGEILRIYLLLFNIMHTQQQQNRFSINILKFKMNLLLNKLSKTLYAQMLPNELMYIYF